ncbi:MAG TPA: hypothetical protein PKA88_05365 [Polyangiaceae bacterium]|nr:hypothetical protein [Polyangiaceae bacterium]
MQGGYGGGPSGWGGAQGAQGPPGAPAGYAAPGGAPGPAAGGSYEFTSEQDAKIARLGNVLVFSGILQIIWGLGQGTTSWVFGLGQWLYNAPISLALIIIGIMFCLTGASFKKIQSTQGNDIQHLMEAVGKLTAAGMIQIAGFIISMLLGAVILILIFVVGAIALVAS